VTAELKQTWNGIADRTPEYVAIRRNTPVRMDELTTNPMLAARCHYLAGSAYRRIGETERAEIQFAHAAACQ
jgi:hypothetical protein